MENLVFIGDVVVMSRNLVVDYFQVPVMRHHSITYLVITELEIYQVLRKFLCRVNFQIFYMRSGKQALIVNTFCEK